ncbi:MAG: murein biosynthesis integral membrane protein MurJ [Actinobacteria bacterium]|nr:murein biosynthesis integral membrane protein MurJ [Actinomycetota bacterium]
MRSSAVVGLGTALSRITGFLRVSAMAAIGFGHLTDVYNIANSTPNIVYELLLGGILTATLVPLFVEQLHRDDEHAKDAINSVAVVGLVVVTLLGLAATPWIIRLYTLRLHGSDRAVQQRLATDLLFLFMPQILFYGITALATAMLNARRRFAAAAFAPVLNNVVVIGVFLALPHVASGSLSVQRVHSSLGLTLLLGAGTTAGIVAMALVLWPALRGAGVRFRFTRDWRHPAVRQLARLSGWTFGYVAANQIAFLVVLFLSYGRTGDASVYIAAFTFFQLPHGLFAVSLMTTLVPELAARASLGDIAGFRTQFSLGLRLMGVVVVPAAVVMVVLARPIVNGLLLYGHFTTQSASRTAAALAMFGLGLFCFSAYLFALRGFYALQDTRTPFVLNCFENGVNIVVALALYPVLHVTGLALSWSVAYALASVAAVVALRRRLGRLDGSRMTRSIARVTLASGVLGVVAWLVATGIGYGSGARALLALAAAGVAGAGAYVAVLVGLHADEVTELRNALRRSRPAGSPSTVRP